MVIRPKQWRWADTARDHEGAQWSQQARCSRHPLGGIAALLRGIGGPSQHRSNPLSCLRNQVIELLNSMAYGDTVMEQQEPSSAADAREPDSLLLQLDGFEGPLDLLLDLARAQKVDLAKISILSLVDQYLAMIEGARRIRLELAADWLVMAAWLTWLKSRLLVPAGADDDLETGEMAAEALAARLREMNVIRTLAAWFSTRPVLGQDVFARGLPESHHEYDRSRIVIESGPFVRAYLDAIRRGTRSVQ